MKPLIKGSVENEILPRFSTNNNLLIKIVHKEIQSYLHNTYIKTAANIFHKAYNIELVLQKPNLKTSQSWRNLRNNVERNV